MRGRIVAKRHAKKLRAKYGPSKRLLDVFNVAKSEGIRLIKEDSFKQEVSGLFLNNDGNYIIAVNKKHSTTRQRFTVAHELGHFILHKEEKLHYDSLEAESIFFRIEGEITSQETEANHFAAELLMPEELINEDFKGTPEVASLATRYGVSESAMMYRLINLGLM